MAGVDAGEQMPCPACGTTVLHKAMIPVLGPDGQGVRYLCIECARALVVHGSDADPHGPEAGEEAETATAEPAEPSPA